MIRLRSKLLLIVLLLFAAPSTQWTFDPTKFSQLSNSEQSKKRSGKRTHRLNAFPTDLVSDVTLLNERAHLHIASFAPFHYYVKQSLCAAAFSVLGDAIAQMTTEFGNEDTSSFNRPYDTDRGVAFFIKGLGSGIIWAAWFNLAEVWSSNLTELALSEDVLLKNYPLLTKFSPSTLHQIVQTTISILMEQFLVCPPLYGLWEVPVTCILRGSPMRQIPSQVQEKLGPLLIANAKVWTLVNCITYNVPVEFRVLFSSAADIVWQAISASITAEEIHLQPPQGSTMTTLETSTTDLVFAQTAEEASMEAIGDGIVNAAAVME
jgi:hypothetical protein